MARIVVVTSIWIVTQVLLGRSSQSFDIRNFRCSNGKYVRSNDFCDHAFDCGGDDRSDQSFGCSTRCGLGRFDCGSDGPCIPITKRCNTIKECPDGSDELNCGNETDIDHCSLLEGKYLCQDRLKCLDLSNTCDGACNCLDCSDESADCRSLSIGDSCFSCAANCLPNNYNGTQCVCNSGQDAMRAFCTENFSLIKGQLCIRYKSITRCQCYENYHAVHQLYAIKCRHNVWLGQKLIYSTATKIKILNVTTYNHSKIIQDDVNCTILTAAKDYLYYAAYHEKKERIFKTPINGGKPETITELDSTIKSLAVDWISSNLYFTSNNSVFVCSKDGRICTRLKCCGIDYLALAPKFGWMFYIHNGIGENEQLIMKSNMDGSEEKIFIDMIFYPSTSLAIDEWAETLYCFEMEKTLYSFSLNGSNELVYSLSTEGFSTQFSVLERYSFFIKKNDNKIYNTTISDWNSFTTRADKETNKIRNLFTYNPAIQFSYEIANPCLALSCNGLCLLRPGSVKNELNYTCMCENFIPSDDNSWCGDQPNRSVLEFKSYTKHEAPQIDSSTEPSSTSTLKNYASTSTKPSIVFSSPPESLSFERYPATGYFNIIMSCMTFALGVLMLYLLNGINHSMKHRQTITSGELIEL